MAWFYYVGKAIIKILLLFFTDCQIKGKQNVPTEDALIVAANHVNLFDTPILGVSLGREITFMAKQELFSNPVFSFILRGIGAFPVHRQRLDRAALRTADRILAEGLALAVFPEGSRSKDAKLKPPLMGTVRIALHNSAPILPVGISGTEKIKGFTWLFRRPKIVVNIGQPFALPSVNGRLSRLEVAELADAMMIRIAELLPLEYHGHYAGQGDLNAIKN